MYNCSMYFQLFTTWVKGKGCQNFQSDQQINVPSLYIIHCSGYILLQYVCIQRYLKIGVSALLKIQWRVTSPFSYSLHDSTKHTPLSITRFEFFIKGIRGCNLILYIFFLKDFFSNNKKCMRFLHGMQPEFSSQQFLELS